MLIPHILSNNQFTVEQLSQSKTHFLPPHPSEEIRMRCGSALYTHTLSQKLVSAKKIDTSYYKANIHMKAICLEPPERLLVADTRLFLGSRIVLRTT